MSRTRLRAGLVLSAVAVLLLGAACKRNHPPSVPEVTGRLVYRPGDTARLSAAATDQDDDSLSYLFAWGDSTGAVWTDNYPNGTAATATCVYAEPDTCLVMVKARDSKDAESRWSAAETLRVGLFAPGVPACPVGPDSGVTADTYRCSTHAASPYGEPVQIEYDWDGAPGDTYPPVASDSPCIGTHVFYLSGVYHVRARASDTSGLISAWSDSLAVTIACHDTTPPAVSIISPGNGDTVKRGVVFVEAVATDDQVVTRVEYAVDGTLAGMDSVPEGDTFRWAWADTAAQVPGRSYTIATSAYDAAGHEASAAISVFVVESGVKWYWQDPEEGAMLTSAVVANDGAEEVVMSYCWDDWSFHTITTESGRSKSSATTRFPDYDFDGHPGLCAATGHVITGSQEGELYALTLPALTRAWRWPDAAGESLEPFVRFGAPAISGNVIYVGRDDDSLYKFTDNGSAVTKGPAYGLNGATVVDAPAVGADGSVYFGTDSGYLVKIDANLTAPVWRRHLITVGEVNGPIVGSDGTVYCGTDSGELCAVSSSGSIRWRVALDGLGTRPALGRSALFVGTDSGTAYSIDPPTGAINWQESLHPGCWFATTPIVAANGYVYFQDDSDVLFCLNQADGTVLWVCDCDRYVPGGRRSGSPRPRKTGLADYDANPSITADGDIIVVGQLALFCVAGYADGALDETAPWPKWQKDRLNTGR